LFFANADEVRAILTAAVRAPDTRWVVIDLEAVRDIGPSAADALSEAIGAATARDVVIAFSRVRHPIAELLARDGLADVVGPERIFVTNRAATRAYERSR